MDLQAAAQQDGQTPLPSARPQQARAGGEPSATDTPAREDAPALADASASESEPGRENAASSAKAEESSPTSDAPSEPTVAEEKPAEPKKRTFLASLFASTPADGTSARAEAPGGDAGSQKAAAPSESMREEETAAAVTDMPVETAAIEEPATKAEEEQPAEAAEAEAQTAKPQKRGFLSAFFSSSDEPRVPFPDKKAEGVRAEPTAAAEAQAEAENAQAEKPAAKEGAKPVISLASTASTSPAKAAMFSMDALPGVRPGEQLFEIRLGTRSDDGDVDVYEQTEAVYQVASAAGLARLAPNGLLKQRESVNVSCFKPKLVSTLKAIERRFGKKVIVTSGYRSPEHNRRVRGAPRSQHMNCAAADILVEGVSKWEIARFARSLPGRGGVGTYCHTNAVHVDIGPERDWNWRCGRRG
ncbi:D-Ala-D-Ala carboxypeptidase family metallohydrolase [Chelativorans sp. AA-79]|uniref:YcbK family protein n=1 Tax=Chelativorans sp. AA-79 TaxID=3028735 RepID=UPI0023F99285|nr:D-Ala-D-Ala carboxypeptidase family metallohydrolase [Chelativorans sp. AA-79]WEX07589.1 D-Ala-D-Ala carboxypeptidase family metallohydrolase [Chelativorans sp. AA-79]